MAATASAGADERGRDPRDRLAREFGTYDTTMLVVSSVIGSGIFLTPAAIARLLPNPGLVLAAWIAGGLLSLAGALANAELGAMFPRAGGDYVYLREGWHPAAGFLVGWLSFFVIYAGTVASLAVAFGEAVAAHLGLGAPGVLVLAVAATVGTSAINYVGVRRGVQVNNLGGWLKLVGAALFVGAALVLGGGDAAREVAALSAGDGQRQVEVLRLVDGVRLVRIGGGQGGELRLCAALQDSDAALGLAAGQSAQL